MRTGVLGGTFDPPHLGHLVIAETARDSQGLMEVLLIPAGRPVIKSGDIITPAKQRMEMLRLAVEGRPYLSVSDIEIKRPGPSYTVDSITQLRSSSGEEDELYFIIGRDNLEQLPQWREPQELVRLCQLIVVPRPGYSSPDMEKLENSIPGIGERVVMLDGPLVDISASEIREMVARGESIDKMVPGPVAKYIKENELYTQKREV